MTWSRGAFQPCNLGPGRPATTSRSPNRSPIRTSSPTTLLRRLARPLRPRSTQPDRETHQMLARLIAISLALLLLCSRDCVAQAVDPGAVRVGDRWAYDIRDDLSGDLRRAIRVVVVEVNDKEITTRVSSPGKDHPQTMVYDLDWGRIDDGAWKLRPSGIGIKTPLQIGKEWRSDANAINLQSGVAFRASGVAKVMAQEKVTTAAGTFETYRINA